MVNPEIRTLHEPDGTPVCNVAFDLSAEQLAAAAAAAADVIVERHRGAALDTDQVLAMRELTGVRDELDGLAAAGGHARITVTLGRFIALHDALDEYVATRDDREWMRQAERETVPVVRAMLLPMEALRADALAAVLGAETRSH